jgi:hypothetical protein
MSSRREAFEMLRAHPRRSLWLLIAPFFTRRVRKNSPRPKRRAEIAAGTCLRPWLVDGEIVVFDQNLAPEPGDIVITRTPIRLRAGFGTPSRIVAPMGAKQLKVDDCGRRWLCSADGAYPADPEHEIIGTVTHVARRPWRKPPPMAEMRFPIRPIDNAA